MQARLTLVLAFFVATAAFAQPIALPNDCAAYASVPPTEATVPTTPSVFPACASYRSYRGIGRPINLAQARACAYQERLAQQAELPQNGHEPTSWVVGGSLILADIYFNGAGVPRNIPLALRFACEAEPATAELALPDTLKLNGTPPPHPPFEFCDYAATTFTENFCAGYTAEIADERRARHYAALRASLPPPERAAFNHLLAAANTYINTHALEVYQGGTIRAIRTLGSQTILTNLFSAELTQFTRGQLATPSAHQVVTADAELERAYTGALRRAHAQTPDTISDGSVTPENLVKVQQSWFAYRDAWLAFARLRNPAATEALRARVTLDRAALLRTIN